MVFFKPCASVVVVAPVVATKQRWLYPSSCGVGLYPFASLPTTCGVAVTAAAAHSVSHCGSADDRHLLGDDYDDVGVRDNRG